MDILSRQQECVEETQQLEVMVEAYTKQVAKLSSQLSKAKGRTLTTTTSTQPTLEEKSSISTQPSSKTTLDSYWDEEGNPNLFQKDYLNQLTCYARELSTIKLS